MNGWDGIGACWVLVFAFAPEQHLSPLQRKLNVSCWTKRPMGVSRTVSKLTCLPTFVIVGTPRSGSTTLFDNLKKHDNIMLWDSWEDKELNFLNWNGKYDRYYAEALPPMPIGLDAITGEASVRYFMHPQVGVEWVGGCVIQVCRQAAVLVSVGRSVRDPSGIVNGMFCWRGRHTFNG